MGNKGVRIVSTIHVGEAPTPSRKWAGQEQTPEGKLVEEAVRAAFDNLGEWISVEVKGRRQSWVRTSARQYLYKAMEARGFLEITGRKNKVYIKVHADKLLDALMDEDVLNRLTEGKE